MPRITGHSHKQISELTAEFAALEVDEGIQLSKLMARAFRFTKAAQKRKKKAYQAAL